MNTTALELNRDHIAESFVATAMVRSLNFVLSREFLGLVQVEECEQSIFSFGWKDITPALMPTWFRVSRIGISSGKTCKVYLDAIQRILHSLNDEAEILFLVKNSKKKVDLFLGIRFRRETSNRAARKAISSYANGIWKGLELSVVNEEERESIDDFETCNSPKSDKAYDTIYALTGIPSANEDDVIQMTIERFLSGAAKEDVALLISATPLKASEIDDSLYALREIGGEIESLKTMSVNKGESLSKSIQDTITQNTSVSEKDFAIIGERILTFASDKLGFKPAMALNKAIVGTGAFAGAGYAVATKAAAAAATAAGSAAAGPIAAIGAIGLLSGLIPQKSISHGTSHSEGTTTQTSSSVTTTIINKHAEGATEKINGQINRYEDGRACGMWKVGVYIFGEDTEATNAAYQLKAIVTGKSSALEPIRIHNITSLLEEKGNPFVAATTTPHIEITSNNDRFEDTISRHDAELKTILTTKELSNYINFPLQPMPGLRVKEMFKDCSLFEPTYDEGVKTIDFGNLIRDGVPTSLSCKVPIDRLSSHALVAGINGSGKTNSILSVLRSLGSCDIPFMVIEPAKTEYVDWALKYNDDLKEDQKKGLRLNESPIKIFMPGRNSYKRKIDKKELYIDFKTTPALRINPFEAIDLGEDSMNILSHIDRIKEVFAAAFPMQDILPVVFENLLYYVYRGTGWLAFKERKPKRYPYMSMVHGCIDPVVDGLGYEEKNTMTIKACLNTRLSSLMNGWKGEMLDNDREEGISWNELFSSPCVINLSAVGDNTDKAFIMSLMMTFLYEYREAEASLSGFEYSNKLRHLVVLEEAHRIMSYSTYQDSPKARSGEMFSNMLSEVRAFGQGLMIVDQVPTRLIPDSIKNTSLKIIHRLVSEDDISALASASGIKEDSSAMISSLAVGEAIITGADNGPDSTNNGEIYLCKVKKLK